MPGIQTSTFNVEQVRERLRDMTDQELLRFGQAARNLCSPEANMAGPPRQESVIQLYEARAEWRRRFPKLPLKESL
jgi:hypothetical protein